MFCLMLCWFKGSTAEPVIWRIALSESTHANAPYLIQDLASTLQNLNISSELITLSKARAYTDLNNGTYDIGEPRVLSSIQSFPDLIPIPVPVYAPVNVYLWKPKGKTLEKKPVEDLYIGYIHGSSYARQIIEQRGYAFTSPISFEISDIPLFVRNRLDAVIISEMEVDILTKNGVMPPLEPITGLLATYDLFIPVHKRHQEVIPYLKAEIEKEKAKGRFEIQP